MANNPTLQDLRIGHLEYNGFTFPALTEINATLKPKYDESGNSVKWFEMELYASFIYYPTAEDLPAGVDLSGGKSYSDSSYLPTYMASIASDLRRRLLQPAQTFSMSEMSLGTITLNSGPALDLNGGPLPTECTWAPIAGNTIAQFGWRCTLHIPPGCLNGYANYNGIVSLTYSTNWDSSEDANFQFIRTVSGQVEFINRRNPVTTATGNKAFQALGSLNLAVRQKIYPVLDVMFPKPAGYKRSRSMSLAENQRVLSFTFVDAEIMKDTPAPRPILDMKLRHGIQSDIEKGFGTWKVSFQGEVTVAKARNSPTASFSSQKKLAWVAIGKMISNRLQQASNQSWANGSKSNILTDIIEINDDVNEPTFSFNLQYRILHADDKTIFRASGMFDVMGLPGETWANREQYLSQIMSSQDAIVPWPMDQPPTMDACTYPIGTGIYQENDNKVYLQTTENSRSVKSSSQEESHIWMENNYDIDELNQSSVHVPLSNSQESRREVISGDIPSGLVPVSDGFSNTSAPLPIVVNPTARTYVVTMHGYCLRAGAPTTPPKLVSYGNKPCIKIGSDKIRIREQVVGVVLDPTKTSMSIYRTSWLKKYLVYGHLSPNEVATRVTDRTSVAPSQLNNSPIA